MFACTEEFRNEVFLKHKYTFFIVAETLDQSVMGMLQCY